MQFISTDIDDVFIINQNIFHDDRGYFVKTFHENEFKNRGLEYLFKESYYSESKKNVIRGMHFQIPPAEHAKLATVIYGKILDVIVDLRTDSLTFKKFVSVELSREKRQSIYIPKGCAHGFCSLTEQTLVYYMTSTVYNANCDQGIRWDSFGFDWPVKNPIISKRDLSFSSLAEFKSPF